MAYMLLWSGIERSLTLRHSLGSAPARKVAKLGEDLGFADALKKFVPGCEAALTLLLPIFRSVLDAARAEAVEDKAGSWGDTPKSPQ